MFGLIVEFIICWFFCYSFLVLPVEANNKKKDTEYAPPGTACFPYGDEEMNTNVLQKPELNEVRQQREEGKKSDCPQRCSSSSDLKDPHITCEHPPGPYSALYTSDTPVTPELKCKKCSIRVTEDQKAVVLQCFNCVQTNQEGPNRFEQNLIYMVSFIEIANYTSPEGDDCRKAVI